MKRNRTRQNPAHKNDGTNASDSTVWLWGTHAVLAALRNPARKSLKLYASKNAASHLPVGREAIPVSPHEIDQLLPEGAAHQGLALQAWPLPESRLDDALNSTEGVFLMLDGVTDPRNIGAILRSAAAFGARGVIVQDRKTPPLGGVLAKAAAGALETVPLFRVVNLARTLEQLGQAGWHSVGLAGDTRTSISDALDTNRLCLVMGSEGKGLRPNVAKHCDQLARIPISTDMESLNVSTAAAIALYELTRD